MAKTYEISAFIVRACNSHDALIKACPLCGASVANLLQACKAADDETLPPRLLEQIRSARRLAATAKFGQVFP